MIGLNRTLVFVCVVQKLACESKKAEATDSSVATASTEVCTLFIGQLNNTTSEGDVKCKEVRKVENKTFCYVNLAGVDDLDKAIRLSGGDIDGATATIEKARPKNNTSNARTPNTPQGGKDSSVMDMDTDTEDSGNGDQDETELTKWRSSSVLFRVSARRLSGNLC
ncbi:uncharacterized protein [Littorina saxatilis]|uniref:uncharacterized protein n=1 Tax=Littorina saxatilis TaxID=31220 RepID=UPI0038B5516A